MSVRPYRVTRLLFWSLVAVAVVGVPGLAVAKPARSTSGVIYASANHVEGSDLYVSGDLKDKLLGRGAIVYVVQAESGPTPGSVLVKADKITIYTTKGSLTGEFPNHGSEPFRCSERLAPPFRPRGLPVAQPGPRPEPASKRALPLGRYADQRTTGIVTFSEYAG